MTLRIVINVLVMLTMVMSPVAEWLPARAEPLNLSAPVTTRISVGSGGQGNYDSSTPSISLDGRYGVFASNADTLVPGDTNGVSDIFLRDLSSSTTTRISAAPDGSPANGGSYRPSLSADGRYVVFESDADNLVPGDTNGYSDIFLRDRETGLIERISVSTNGTEENSAAFLPSISVDGRYVVFSSYANNLVPGDTNGCSDVFLRDRQWATTTRVSISSGGGQGNFDSYDPTISADGNFIAFLSAASNLVASDFNGSADVFVRDRQSSATERVSVSTSGSPANGESFHPAISADGRFVVFASYAENLVSGDDNGVRDIFIRDRKNKITGRVSVASDGAQADYSSYNPSISLDGRYVVFDSDAGNLVPGDTNGFKDIFIRDRQNARTERISVSSGGGEGNSDSVEPTVSADGRLVAFTSYASSLVGGDTNDATDIFLRNRCPDGSCAGMAAQPQITASPATLTADGTTTTTITLMGAEAGQKIILHSGRESVDIFGAPMGVVDVDGRYTTTLKSAVPGYAVLSVEEVNVKDVSQNVILPLTTTVTFTDPSGAPLPPPPTGDVSIANVDSSLPLDGRYFDGLEAPNKMSITVDWKGTPPGYVEYNVNGVKKTISAVTTPVMFDMPFDTLLQPGSNAVSFTAISIMGKRSEPRVYSPTLMALPDWLKGLEVAGMIGKIVFKSEEGTANVTFPKNKIKIGGGPAELEFKVGGSAKLSLRCDEVFKLNFHGGGEIEAKFKRAAFGGSLEIKGEGTGGAINCWIPTAKGEIEVKLTVYGQYNWPVLIFIGEFVNKPAADAIQALAESIGLDETLDILGHVYIRVSLLADIKVGMTLIPQDPYIEWDGFTVGAGVKPEAGYEYELEAIGLKFKTWVALTVEAKKNTSELTLRSFDVAKWDSLEATGEAGYKFEPPMLDCAYERVYSVKWTYEPNAVPDMSVEANLSKTAECNIGIFGSAPRPRAVFYGSPAAPQAFNPDIQISGPSVKRSGTLSLYDAQTASSVLVSDVYHRAEPALAVNPADNHALMLWVHDDTTQPQWQSHEIAWSLWNGTSWSAPATITHDNYLDAAPQVAWDAAGNAVAVWVRLPQTLDASATWNEATAQKFEIATATYNAASGSWSAPALLTSNAALDLKPALARAPSGKLLMAWKQNDAGKLMGGAANPDRLMVATYQNGAWGAPVAAADTVPGINDLSAADNGVSAVIAYTRFVIPTSGGDPQQQVFTLTRTGSTWGAPVQQTDDTFSNMVPRAFYNASGEAVLVWMAGSELRLRNLATGAQSVMRVPEDVGMVNEFRLVQDGSGNNAVTFTAQAAAQRDLFLAFYDQQNNVWGAPRRLTGDTDSEFSPATALDTSGRLLVGYLRTAQTTAWQSMDLPDGRGVIVNVPTDGPSDLVTLSHDFNSNLSLSAEDLSVSDPAPREGQAISFSAAVHNTGDTALDGVKVAFYNGDPASGGVLLGSAALDTPLPGQSSAAVTADYTFTGAEPVDLYAVVDPDGAVAESSEIDNTAHLPLFQPDLIISSASVDYWGGTQYGLKAVVANQGASPAGASTLRFSDPANPGADLTSAVVPALQSGESTVLTLPWQNASRTAGSYPLLAAVDPLPTGELDAANNQSELNLDVQANLAVSPYTVWVEDWSAADKQAHVQVLNTGAVEAQNVVVALYSSAHQSPAFLLASQTIPALPAGQAQTLDFTLTADLPCGLYAQVNPDGTVAETDRSDNLAKASSPAGGACTAEQDWTPPAAPVIDQPAEGAALTGLTPTFSGTAEPGSTVTVAENGAVLCTASADASGAWSCTPTAPMPEGAHTVSAEAADAASNVSAQTVRAFTLKTKEYGVFLPMVRK